MTTEEMHHLCSRAGFGSTAFLNAVTGRQEAVDLLLRPPDEDSTIQLVSAADWKCAQRKALLAAGMSPEEAQRRVRSFRGKTNDLILYWMEAMRSTQQPLREKMALFWHGHFASRVGNPYFEQELLNVLRGRGLGSFGELLTAVAQSPAMLQFLNNQQNRRAHPNENFARELMELFTLGRGQYSEADVKEAARAFTGWSYDGEGLFSERPRRHDDGSKTFLGQTGNFGGSDILRIILEKKDCARFIAEKIYRYFVNEEDVPERRLEQLVGEFYRSGYDLAKLMRSIFSADWFYSAENRAARIKSPVELLVGLQQLVPVRFESPALPIRLQRLLGQHLFHPPNVAGWPGGRDWVDSSSLLLRVRLPEALLAGRELDLREKETDAEMDEAGSKAAVREPVPESAFRVGKVLSADWQGLYARFAGVPEAELPRRIADALLPLHIPDKTLQTLSRFTDPDSREERIRSLAIRVMGLPEFQLC